MSRPHDVPRDLLFGLLALQTGIINQGQLVAAFQAWTLDKSKSLADHLEARGDITGPKRALLEGLADVHLETHGGDVEKSLAAVPANRFTRASLAVLGEPEIEATLARVARRTGDQATKDDDPDRTSGFSVGESTSDGQRFRILRPHARGGLGEVFVAMDAELHREVALKQILEKHADEPVSRHRFVAEAEITGGLEHPGVVPVYGLGTYGGGRPYYAMRFIKGDSLKEAIERYHAGDVGWVARSEAHQKASQSDSQPVGLEDSTHPTGNPGRRSLELRKLLRRFLDVCNAIDYAHSRGVIHRDIKPANIIVGKHGETLVVDWGLAKAIGRADPSAGEQTLAPSSGGSSETLPGSALGTPAYMSPEQARGDLHRLGPRSDVYSLGATLYCLLTGKPPFENEDVGVILRAVQEGHFQRPTQLEPSLDKALEVVCLKAMALKPEDRYATPKALAEDVERWAADESVSAWAEPWMRKLLRWLTRHRTVVTGAAAALLAGVVGLTAVLAVQTRAYADLKSANLDLALANNLVKQANGDLKSANDREKQRFSLAMDAIKLFHGEVSEDLLMKEKQFEGLRTKLLKGATDFYGRLEGLLKGQADRESRAALGRAYDELGELTGKIGEQPAALAVHRKALAVRRALAAEPGADAGTKLDVVRRLIAAGLLQESPRDMAGALESYSEARALAAAEAGGREADQARQMLGTAYSRFGLVLALTDDPAGALAAYGEALAIRQKLADANPGVAQFQRGLAATHSHLGLLLRSTGDPAGALTALGKAQAILQKLIDANPSDTPVHDEQALTHHNAGLVLQETGDTAGALASQCKALAVFQSLADANPSVSLFQDELASTHISIGRLMDEMGDPAGALPAYGKALAIFQKLVDANPKVPDYRLFLALSQIFTADALRRIGRNPEGRDRCERAITLLERLVQDHPEVPSYRDHVAGALRCRGLARLGLGDLAGASADTRRAMEVWDGLASRVGEQWFETACCHATLACLAGRDGSGVSSGAASAEADKAMALLTKAVATGFRNANVFRIETALDPLRNRPDFRLLMMDLAFPEEPFAR